MIILYTIAIIVSMVACYTDYKESKIKNKYVIPFIPIGLLLNIIIYNVPGGKSSLMGTLFPFLIFLIFFALKMLGGGDIKLFMAIGSLLGVSKIINIIVYSFISTGVFGIIILLKKGILLDRTSYMFNWLKKIIYKNYTPYEYNSKDAGIKMSFGILCGVIIELVVYIANYGKLW